MNKISHHAAQAGGRCNHTMNSAQEGRSFEMLIGIALWSLSLLAPPAGAQTLFDFESGFKINQVGVTDACIRCSRRGGNTALRIETGHEKPWPGIVLKAPKGRWNLEAMGHLALTVRNVGSTTISVSCRVDNPGADGRKHCTTGSVRVDAGCTALLRVPLFKAAFDVNDIKLFGMRGSPLVKPTLDLKNVTQLVIFVARPRRNHTFEIDDIRAGGVFDPFRAPRTAKEFFPLIDEFGQYIHREWPGKTHTLEELRNRIKGEEKDLATHPGPSDRNRFGGWIRGPKLKSTKFFRVEKYRDRWWLVDPEGRLFWSHGLDCVHDHAATPITDRTHWYRHLPAGNSPFAQFYGKGRWAPHGYYKDHQPYRTYDFYRANLLRKYGKDWRDAFADITHRRFRSWGLNTIANWSDARICRMRKTPYVISVHINTRKLEGSKGYWGKYHDVFDPEFRKAIEKSFKREKGKSAGDLWCLGYFVDNEISWGRELSLAVATLRSPPHQAAKRVFVADLKTRYGTIRKLNTAWGTRHSSWKDLLESRIPPDRNRAGKDLAAFSTKTAETYFRTIREEMKKTAPHQLYLGCRFSSVNDRAVRAAVKWCDVVSFNWYRYSVEDRRLPDGLDRPTIIGEFHFGALDRGLFHTGLRAAKDQNHRAHLYERYVRSALRNPFIVGTHWFQYKDQAATGRGDGENYQIGFVDGCDRPYPEIVAAARCVGADLYRFRLGQKK